MTSKQTYTPGPWETNGERVYSRIFTDDDGNTLTIAKSFFIDNSALIAAAPDLLAACIEAKNWIMEHSSEADKQEHMLDCDGDNGRCVLCQLTNAIAKAEGR